MFETVAYVIVIKKLHKVVNQKMSNWLLVHKQFSGHCCVDLLMEVVQCGGIVWIINSFKLDN